MPPHEMYRPGDMPDDPDFVFDELAYSFPEHHGDLPHAHPAPWGMFDKARQVPRCIRAKPALSGLIYTAI